MDLKPRKVNLLILVAFLLVGSDLHAEPVPDSLLEDPGRTRRARTSFLLRESAPNVALRNIPAGGNPDVSGVQSESSAYLKVAGIGRAKIAVSASWDYSGYSTAHPCALVNVTPHDFSGNVFVNGVYNPAASWTADATVTITRDRRTGDTITGQIRGGSVCQLFATASAEVSPNLPCSVNESLIAFTVTGGTGRYQGVGGSGSLRAVVNSCAIGGLPYDLTTATAPADAADAIVLDQISLRLER